MLESTKVYDPKEITARSAGVGQPIELLPLASKQLTYIYKDGINENGCPLRLLLERRWRHQRKAFLAQQTPRGVR